eukprot:CAMPEP_0204904310 /NCGR_PEP_ID=MMETSP1397-20131031/4795_1 /ASSEMBLY_ACC=CAM_ASM_000891 /TAXON_ID=49980 /ORGANISM="Climacostomum Climacostomum virens, Strain Stock W-24" /LENGTH=226 /DNA_ID=CAMNT_0052073091 /DNA_START=460 /DNA_END=1140 /DNA_ORIENTATION=-
MEHDELAIVEDWGYSLILVADVNQAIALASRHSLGFRWWKDFVITPDQLSELTESGDILLFKSKSFLAKTLRTMIHQPYDHVGMIVYYHGLAYVIEAISNMGVIFSLINKTRMEEWRHYYSKVVYRKLQCPRSAEFQETIILCLRKWSGVPYELSIEKLVRNKSLITDRETFFCSQLVAAFYKKLKLLPTGVSACGYWPSSFSAHRKLALPEGVSLGEEMELSLSA